LEYGAFPTDPYSHTPAFAGVQQPGMTGQVKEDIISRLGELGVIVADGRVRFSPTYLRREEFNAEAQEWVFSTGSEPGKEILPPDSLAFCFCGVPVIYRVAKAARIRLYGQENEVVTVEGEGLDRPWSQALFARNGHIRKIEVMILEER
jgi:hypothetical protein